MTTEVKTMAESRSDMMQRLAANTRVGYSFDREFYCDDAVFEADMDQVISRKWTMAGHVGQVPNKGDFFVFKIGDEQIIIIRENATSIRAFYNVCRHRGSLVCSATSGNAPKLVCPYHAWTYGLDGALLSARLMPDDFDKTANGLIPCHVREYFGFIFINMTDGTPDDFDATFGDMAAILDYHGFADAKVAHKASYPTAANWKLVVENFLECYHCQPAHPEFCSMHPPEALVAVGAGPSSGPTDAVEAYMPVLEAWERRVAAMGRPVGNIDDTPDSTHLRLVMQRTIRDGYQSETADGTAASSLMGKRTEFDGGRMHLAFSPISHVVACNDFAILFQFTPRTATLTDVDISWIVGANAENPDVAKMVWAWDVTTVQDRQITEDNQAGIQSKRYIPGRYSDQERGVVNFQSWYLNQFGLQRAD